jgi:molybdopterin converting factor subunit 1
VTDHRSPTPTPARGADTPAATVRVLLVAGLREAAGAREVWIELPKMTTVAALRERLAVAYPALAGLLPNVAFAVNETYAENAAPVRAGDTVAAIPPVSGG